MAYELQSNTINLTPDVAIGIKLPMIGKLGNLFDQSYSTQEQAISNLKNLLFTIPGERVMQPLFGTELRSSLFEQNDNALRNDIYDSIARSIEFWLPYTTINELIVTPVATIDGAKEEHGVTISLKVSVNGIAVNTPITFLVTSSTIEEI